MFLLSVYAISMAVKSVEEIKSIDFKGGPKAAKGDAYPGEEDDIYHHYYSGYRGDQ
ncbi:MAG: hypothetical protein KF916_01380 [Microbacteriaceae bacterium]|nr:hypothetical protein [Microbacteriaceae bacterium]